MENQQKKLDMIELLDSLGQHANDCQWMIGTGDITFHNETLK